MITLNRILVVEMYFPQPREKRILIDSHPSSFNPSTFESFKGSKKKEREREKEENNGK